MYMPAGCHPVFCPYGPQLPPPRSVPPAPDAPSLWKVLDAEPTEAAVRYRGLERMCTCQVREGAADAVSTCTRALELEKEPRIYCERAEAYMNDDLFDEAIRDYQQVG